MKNKQSSFTLVELLVGLVVGAIIILIIGVLSSVSNSSYNKIRSESEVYNDIFYSFDLIKHACRAASSVNWTTTSLTCTNSTGSSTVFGIINNNFTYTDVSSQYTIVDKIESPSLNCTQNGGLYNITLSGKKENVTFNLSTDIDRRN